MEVFSSNLGFVLAPFLLIDHCVIPNFPFSSLVVFGLRIHPISGSYPSGMNLSNPFWESMGFSSYLEIIPILSLAVIPNTIALIFSSKFLGDQKSKFPLIGVIIYASSYLLMVMFLGSLYGLYGLSMSFLISSIIYSSYLVITYKIQKRN